MFFNCSVRRHGCLFASVEHDIEKYGTDRLVFTEDFPEDTLDPASFYSATDFLRGGDAQSVVRLASRPVIKDEEWSVDPSPMLVDRLELHPFTDSIEWSKMLVGIEGHIRRQDACGPWPFCGPAPCVHPWWTFWHGTHVFWLFYDCWAGMFFSSFISPSSLYSKCLYIYNRSDYVKKELTLMLLFRTLPQPSENHFPRF